MKTLRFEFASLYHLISREPSPCNLAAALS
jgi:hypothetical protein